MDSEETLRQFYRSRALRQSEDARTRRARYEALLPRIVEGVLERDPLVSRIVLFGSLAEQAEGIVRDIDVVDLNDLYPHVRDRVETKGRVLYERHH